MLNVILLITTTLSPPSLLIKHLALFIVLFTQLLETPISKTMILTLSIFPVFVISCVLGNHEKKSALFVQVSPVLRAVRMKN